ncbi:MAG: carbohydrate binding domain-containing protein [Patescibacteria group bacterium]
MLERGMKLNGFNQFFTTSKSSFILIGILLVTMVVAVSVSLTPQGQPSQAALGANIVKNPSFESGKTSWQLNQRSPGKGTFATTTSTKNEGNNSAQITVTRTSSNPAGVELAQYGLPLTAGKTYTVSFWAKASANRSIRNVIQLSSSPYTLYSDKTFSLTSNWQQFSYTFNSTVTKTNILLGFQMAQATGTVWIDTVQFAEGTVTSATPTVTPTPIANATLYGKEGTFGQLATATTLPSGQTFKAVPVTNWGFLPGESGFFSNIASNGEIVIGTTPLTDNQVYSTGDTMDIGVFNPATNSFRNIMVPTTTGKTNVTNPFHPVGGASVESLVPVTVAGQSRLAFISLVPYHGWDIAQNGEFPSLGYLDVVNGSVQYNPTLSKSANQIYGNGGASAVACPQSANIFGQQVANCRGFGEMSLLPLSQKFVITQYFPDTAKGEYSGRIIVMNTDGSVAASYTYPNIPNSSGGYLTVNPREVVVDPTATGSLEYFTIISDVADNGVQHHFPLQEFAYNRSTNQITPISAPVFSGQKASNGQIYRFETAMYDSLGNLWATQALSGSLAGGPIVVYTKNSGVRKLETATCTVTLPWTGIDWGKTCTPDRSVAGTGEYGQTRSFTQDPTTKTVFATTLSGYLLRVKQSGSGTGLTLTNLSPITIGMDQLVDRNQKAIGVRKGVVDVKNRALYIPVVQVYNQTDCPTWPGSTPCALQSFDQWLYRFNLDAISS